ncbi:protein spire homolog 1-like [Littorina saxatilis]|uniref:protein spire homolog 1-like n=1 Tax=Littorina saxatilis TaxID=31220 RepID=UPI0038B42EFA
MASRSSQERSDVYQRLDNDGLPFSDVLRFFNNPINEEQAWAVCYQCAQFYLREHSQEGYQDLYEYGLQSVCLNREGEVRIRSGGSNGSGKGPPGGEYYPSKYKKRHATEHDAVQTLGRVIFEALDYGIGEAEERPLSHGLETLIETMTRSEEDDGEDTENQSADDEGIEKDAEEDHHCTFKEVARLCTQHLSSRQDANYHYRAVSRALVAEAVELHTFLNKIARSRHKLQTVDKDQDARLQELERADWARLWMQVMRSLRTGVRLKKNEHQHVMSQPLDYELTPFEMLLEDIRTRRYTLHKIMVNGDIPPKVKNDAHAVILDFIRSRPPLRQVKDRKLKSLPPKPPDPIEQLFLDIKAQPKLRPVKDGRLVEKKRKSTDDSDEEDDDWDEDADLETSRTKVSNEDSPPPARKLIKPDFNLLLSSSFEESEEDSEVDSPERVSHRRARRFSPLSSPGKDMNATWHTGPGVGASSHEPRNTKLQRRHTIMVCESPTDTKLALQELPPLEEEEEPSPSEEQPTLHYGSDSPLSGLPDHTLHNGHTKLRSACTGTATRHQGALYRSEHRRSLTMGLTAIPEDEDATDSAGMAVGGGRDRGPSRRHSMPAAPHGVGALLGGRDLVGSGVGDVRSRGQGGGGGLCCGGGSGGGSAAHISRSSTDHEQHLQGKKGDRKGGSLDRRNVTTPKLGPPSGGDAGVSKGEGQEEKGADLALLTASEMMHVSWKTACQRSHPNSASPCQDCRPVPKRWQNPIECLSLTLEEVTHIRSVLTKAELESLISHSDLYNQVAKSKVCFTCKTTRFTLFGEWGTKCKFCKRTVCSKCMRKMHVPTEHFKNIPVYTLSPTPLTREATELIQNYVKTGAPSTTAPPSSTSTPTSATPKAGRAKTSVVDQQKGKRPLQRSQSMTLPTKKPSSNGASAAGTPQTARGPMMSICCDCKGMIMEIIRASKTSLAMLQPSDKSGDTTPPLSSPSSNASQSSSSSC